MLGWEPNEVRVLGQNNAAPRTQIFDYSVDDDEAEASLP